MPSRTLVVALALACVPAAPVAAPVAPTAAEPAKTVTFHAAASGTAKLSGALKLSVCTDEICESAAPSIAFDEPVTAP